ERIAPRRRYQGRGGALHRRSDLLRRVLTQRRAQPRLQHGSPECL
ncbi:MAG: hypothetical protein AVDCRST_MAG14-2697, partial [uncultured Rubrobacteraceae bacterium]